MNLKGKKVLLRAIDKTDLEFLCTMQNDHDIEEMCGSWDYPLSMDRQYIWYDKLLNDDTQIRLIIECLETKEIIGTIYLSSIDWKNRCAFFGIKTISGSTRGKGYGVDAIMTLMQFAYEELQLHRLESFIINYNTISLNILNKFGLEPEGIKRECFFSKGKYYDKVCVSVLDREFYELKRKWGY